MKNNLSFTIRAAAVLCCAAALFFAACKSEPAPAPEPLPAFLLSFRGIEAESPERVSLLFSLETETPALKESRVALESWQAEIGGKKADTGFTLAPPLSGSVLPGTPFPLRLEMDIASLSAEGLAPLDEYRVVLSTRMSVSEGQFPPREVSVSGLAVFPGVRPPEFRITSLAVLKAELINTRFRVGLKIDNPNPFPLELSAFNYTLYGNRRLWAEGSEKNVLTVGGKSSIEGNLFLIMNFINMERSLLDQISRLEEVNYRFSGEVLVSTGVEYLPVFSDSFDFSGYSVVLDE